MSYQSLIQGLTGLGLSLISLILTPYNGKAQTRSFSCISVPDSTGQTILATVYRESPTRRPIVILPWRQNDFPGTRLHTRCQSVSDRFEQFHNDGTLRYIRTGMVHRYPVLCAHPSKKGSPCPASRVLITFKPGTFSKAFITRSFNLDTLRRVISASGNELDFEIDGEIYIDFAELVIRQSIISE